MRYPVTPDGRYFVVRGRLWRCTDPTIDVSRRDALTRELMSARRAKQDAIRHNDAAARDAARERVDVAKRALGEPAILNGCLAALASPCELGLDVGWRS